jgi:hypothetical protein
MNIEQRSALRRKRMKSYRARDFADAERWDLQFWQEQSPEDRLSALVAIRNDMAKVEAARKDTKKPEGTSDGDDSGL